LIIDPVIAPLSWADGLLQNRETLEVIRSLPNLIGTPVRTIAGLSNLTTGCPYPHQKEKIEATYLPMLAAADLDMILMDVFREQSVSIARTCGILLHEGIFSWELV